MFKFKLSNSFKIKILDDQLEQLSSMEKITKVLKNKDVISFDIYKEKILVGFAMLRKCEDGYFLWDYAIDYRYQGLGYGQAVLSELINLLKDEYKAKWISTTYKFGNAVAKHVYEKLGFVQTSIVNENNIHEVNMCLNL